MAPQSQIFNSLIGNIGLDFIFAEDLPTLGKCFQATLGEIGRWDKQPPRFIHWLTSSRGLSAGNVNTLVQVFLHLHRKLPSMLTKYINTYLGTVSLVIATKDEDV